MRRTITSSSPSQTPDQAFRKKISKTFSIPTGRPSAPSAWAPDSDCRSQRASSKRTEGRAGSRASRVTERNSFLRYRWPAKPRSTRDSRRNLQHIADAQLREQPDQSAPFLVGCLVHPAKALHFVGIRNARDRKSCGRLLRKEDSALVPFAILEAIAEKAGVRAADSVVAVHGFRR